jgi:hypothetical protein
MPTHTPHTDTSTPERALRDERDLQVSYGHPTPQPSQKKGDFVAFGVLAGSTTTAPSVQGVRTTHFTDSVLAGEKNL